MPGLGWGLFADSMHEETLKEEMTKGMEAFVKLYYREYSDAVEIDGTTWRALETLFGLGNVDLLDEDLPELVERVQLEITAETKRTFVNPNSHDDEEEHA